jgi:DNA-binding transcriptional MerR regulator
MDTVPGQPQELIKMSELAKRSDVPAPTIKHYIREGLLPGPAKRTSRNMAYYDASLVTRIQRIKQLQRTRYLPLKVIRDLLVDDPVTTNADETLRETIVQVLRLGDRSDALTVPQLINEGVEETDIDWLEGASLIRAVTVDGERAFGGDELRLIRILTRARRAGITPEMLPPQILGPYVQAISDLVRLELAMFREGVLPRATDDLPELVAEAAQLSEELVVVLRRKLLVPTLRSLRSPNKNDQLEKEHRGKTS